MGERRDDGVGVLGEAGQCDTHLGLEAEAPGLAFKNQLGVVLRDHQHVGIRRFDMADLDPGQCLASGKDVGCGHLVAQGNEIFADLGRRKEFERPRPDGDSSRLVAPRRHPVDQPYRDLVAREFKRHRQADRP